MDFLKFSDSVNVQLNDNEFNAKAKYIYCDEKDSWDKSCTTIPFTLPHMNTVVVNMWARLSCEAARTIIRSFNKTHCIPLHPPAMTKSASSACVPVSQSVIGRKATEPDIIRESIIRSQPLLKIPTSIPVVILRATSNTPLRNLVICSASYDVINRSTIIHVQQLKDMLLEINSAKKWGSPTKYPMQPGWILTRHMESTSPPKSVSLKDFFPLIKITTEKKKRLKRQELV